MEAPNLVSLALLAALAAKLGRDALPSLMSSVRPNALRCSFDDAAASHALIGQSVALQRWLSKLHELGFDVLGVKVESWPIGGGTYREVALACGQAETYASIVLYRDASPAALYFYTPFRDGGMVFTRNHARGPEAEDERVSVKNMPTQDFKVIFDSHAIRLRDFKAKGLVPLAAVSQEARIEATRAFYLSEYVRSLAVRDIRWFVASLVLLVGGVCWYANAPC
jgi:hypothetical protein